MRWVHLIFDQFTPSGRGNRVHLVIGGGRDRIEFWEVNAPIVGTGEAWAQVFSWGSPQVLPPMLRPYDAPPNTDMRPEQSPVAAPVLVPDLAFRGHGPEAHPTTTLL